MMTWAIVYYSSSILGSAKSIFDIQEAKCEGILQDNLIMLNGRIRSIWRRAEINQNFPSFIKAAVVIKFYVLD